ncbi:diacylglycerol kinase [Gemmobacter nectariphilus]|uniref:diacylglycerol kinase n=1 Tax=Gemmobacter nectariphilus TaxID=220343 RepID=UPI0003FDBA4A|nr:diacylglycerol kinase [Gemmobacter nectariphilus]
MPQAQDNDAQPKVVPPRGGLMHLIDATGYSLAGFRRLMGETAARHELLGGAVGVGLLIWAGAGVGHWLGFAALFCALLATEALNTAIEVLVDHLSPGWSRMAKEAKDLGSLAVGLMVLANVAFVGAVVTGLV